MLNKIENEVINYLKHNGSQSSKEIFDSTQLSVSFATLKRTLSKLVSENYLSVNGAGKATRYKISPAYAAIHPIDMDAYFKDDIDERKIIEDFNFDIISSVFSSQEIFSDKEKEQLMELQHSFTRNVVGMSENEFKKEFERLAIDLSWKSSQIEGNTYSLLETERLIKEKLTASGKTKEEAVMLLNHKEALDFILENPHYLNPLSVSKIEDIHRLLVKELGVDKNLRKRRIGISGTNYKPLDNEFQLREAMEITCKVINNKKSVFEKALLALVLLSYIQPFMDGNKRTARIVSNAILMSHQYCPISFRTVDSIEYKKAMLLFYEQNNISNFKNIFISQFQFAVETYF